MRLFKKDMSSAALRRRRAELERKREGAVIVLRNLRAERGAAFATGEPAGEGDVVLAEAERLAGFEEAIRLVDAEIREAEAREAEAERERARKAAARARRNQQEAARALDAAVAALEGAFRVLVAATQAAEHAAHEAGEQRSHLIPRMILAGALRAGAPEIARLLRQPLPLAPGSAGALRRTATARLGMAESETAA